MNHPIETVPWGVVDGQPIQQFILRNHQGIQLGVLNYGGTITDIRTPDREGNFGNITLGFHSLEGCLQTSNPYMGVIVGRVTNRIREGDFTIDGEPVQVSRNIAPHTLHGGFQGFNRKIWKVTADTEHNRLSLQYTSPDSEEGFPGNLSVQVDYTLSQNDELIIQYRAVTDRATPVSLSSHCYFNLSGGGQTDILEHELQLFASHYLPIDHDYLPTGKTRSVTQTPFDFGSPKKIGRDISQVTGGYDHNWVLDKPNRQLAAAAVLQCPQTGRTVEMATTEPGIQFYTGNFLDGSLLDTWDGTGYPVHAGCCLEAQQFPDALHHPSFPSIILSPGETYEQTTIYRFGVSKD